MTRFLVVLFCALLSLPDAVVAQTRTFLAEGSDVANAVGARALSMGGSGTASASDPHAVYYNPALIAEFDRPMASFTRQLNAELRPYTYVGVTTPFPLLDPIGLQLALGFASFPRVHVRSTGAFAATDPQSVFLRLLLPGIAGTFDGDIDSKTLVWRFAAGVKPLNSDFVSLGVAIDYIDCQTKTCGVQTGGALRSDWVHARAISVSAGIKFQFSERFRIAGSVSDINTTLNAYAVSLVNGRTKVFTFTAKLPQTWNAEAAWQVNDKLLLTLGYRRFDGSYGARAVDIQAAYLGAEYRFDGGWVLRGGAMRVLRAGYGTTGNLQLPIPVIPSVGAGWTNGDIALDAALYAHPIMSYHYGRAAPTVDISLSVKF